MSTVLEIESAIEKLPSSECRKLLAWFQKYLVTASVLTEVNLASHTKRKSGFEILGDLVGSIKDAPRDLSSNPKYLLSYGKEES